VAAAAAAAAVAVGADGSFRLLDFAVWGAGLDTHSLQQNISFKKTENVTSTS
jgi:hypothetical protein